jgi:hypothetical protein
MAAFCQVIARQIIVCDLAASNAERKFVLKPMLRF